MIGVVFFFMILLINCMYINDFVITFFVASFRFALYVFGDMSVGIILSGLCFSSVGDL